jgi:hypothetical protein
LVDLPQLEIPPPRVAVIHNKKTFGTRLNLIGSAARVIEENATDCIVQLSATAA